MNDPRRHQGSPDDEQPAPRFPRRQLDAASIQGLAHPLRVQMLELLGLFGPATATQLAAKVGESSGATSYHLRQLARYGFIEEDPTRGSGRERWWRRVRGGISLNTHELADDPAAQEAANLVAKEWSRSRQARLDRWQATFDAWPDEWINASSTMSVHLRLTPDELAQLTEELDQVTTRWAIRAQDRDHDDGYTDVEMQAAAFPLGDPPRRATPD